VYSSAAYCPREKVEAWGGHFSRGCASVTSSFEAVETFIANPPNQTNRQFFGYLGIDASRHIIVASFKGTNSSGDTITDLLGGYWDSTPCVVAGVALGNVHQGFCEYFTYLHAAGFGQVRIGRDF
jgi:hypothetical protein